MKPLLRKKAILLLFLMIEGNLPYRVFCHGEPLTKYNNLSIAAASGHHDCPFCSFHFAKDLEPGYGLKYFVSNSQHLEFLILNLSGVRIFRSTSANKGPPQPSC